MRVAENYARSHVNELVDEEETALKHLLVYEHRTGSLGGYHKEDAQQVGRQTGPRSIRKRHYTAVYEGLNLIAVVGRHNDVVVMETQVYAEASEGVRHDA